MDSQRDNLLTEYFSNRTVRQWDKSPTMLFFKRTFYQPSKNKYYDSDAKKHVFLMSYIWNIQMLKHVKNVKISKNV